MLGEVVADIVADLDNVEAADTRTVEEPQEDPTAEDQMACNHLHAVDCSYLEVPLWYDSALTSANQPNRTLQICTITSDNSIPIIDY